MLFQQAGYEPIDAYRDYLREQKTREAFVIYDKKIARDFWRYFLEPDKQFLLPLEKSEAAIMRASSPWGE